MPPRSDYRRPPENVKRRPGQEGWRLDHTPAEAREAERHDRSARWLLSLPAWCWERLIRKLLRELPGCLLLSIARALKPHLDRVAEEQRGGG